MVCFENRYYFCIVRHTKMLGIDSKREVITGEFARKIWSEVMAIWHGEKTAKAEDAIQKYEVEWL